MITSKNLPFTSQQVSVDDDDLVATSNNDANRGALVVVSSSDFNRDALLLSSSSSTHRVARKKSAAVWRRSMDVVSKSIHSSKKGLAKSSKKITKKMRKKSIITKKDNPTDIDIINNNDRDGGRSNFDSTPTRKKSLRKKMSKVNRKMVNGFIMNNE
mmetsp:Transcript_27736/g.31889  ORF Transcript_27736/g.31889 Transcript_27736/m.31889 type:complete len:157 (+) Transcript_27736:3-473(+)